MKANNCPKVLHLNRNDWNVRFEVTFYGNDPNKGSFREIREDNIIFNDEFEIENKLDFNNAAIVKLIFTLGGYFANWEANKITS